MSFFIKKLIKLISFLKKIFREGKGWRKRGRETSMCGCLSSTTQQGPGPHPRHVPWLWIELTTLWSAGAHSIHWAIPTRADKINFICFYFILIRLIKILNYKCGSNCISFDMLIYTLRLMWPWTNFCNVSRTQLPNFCAWHLENPQEMAAVVIIIMKRSRY